MERRTEEEIRAIVKRCVEIEKEGGDVLAYLSSQHYISPYATWFNFQRGYLNRPVSRITSGKPKQKKAPTAVAKAEKIESKTTKEEKHMDENGKKVPKAAFEGTAKTAINIALNGISPMRFLKGKGYAQPAQAWKRIKDWCRVNYPEAYAKIPKNVKTLKQPRNGGTGARPEPKGVVKMEPKEPDGVEVEMKVADEAERWGASPTCCQPAKPSGVTVPDVVPETVQPEKKPEPKKSRFRVREISSKLGVWKWEETGGEVCYTFTAWRSGRNNGVNEGSIRLRVTDFEKLAAEIPEAIKALAEVRSEAE